MCIRDRAFEDKRFDQHRGIDPLGMLRAAGQMLLNGRVVSGGSTLTMQVARLLEPREERTLAAKLRQGVRAVELEQRFDKARILDLYLTPVAYTHLAPCAISPTTSSAISRRRWPAPRSAPRSRRWAIAAAAAPPSSWLLYTSSCV